MIFVGIVGILQMNEDFRMLMQNGFTRTYIFSATVAQFAFISGLMSLIDTAAGMILQGSCPGYSIIIPSSEAYTGMGIRRFCAGSGYSWSIC